MKGFCETVAGQRRARYPHLVHIAVTGSIAMDHLMRFSGRFAESLLTEQLDRVSLSFLVEDLQIRRGGIAPNICFGLAALGLDPLLVGSVGEDFADYRAWLERHGVQTWPVRVSETQHTARFICTTDSVDAQIGSFYTGAMAEARQIELQPIAERAGGLDLVVISPNDPVAMLRHTDECRSRRFNFVADPSQQMAWLDGPQIKRLIDGATYLFSNDYEDGLITQKTGWSHEEILERVGVRVITRGAKGSSVLIAGEPGSTYLSRGRWHGSTRPGWATRTAPDSLRARLGACRWNAARRSALCWRAMRSRWSEPRSIASATRSSLALRRRTARRPPPTSPPTCAISGCESRIHSVRTVIHEPLDAPFPAVDAWTERSPQTRGEQP